MKKILLTIALFYSVQFAFGQVSFSHSFGAALYASSSTLMPALTYSPRVNILELKKEITVSAGTHLGLGAFIDSYTGSGAFMYDIPLVAEINFGHAAKPKTRSSFGGFAGLGYGINKTITDGSTEETEDSANGIIFNAGIRAIINEKALGLRASYLMDSGGTNNIISLGIQYNLGKY